MTTNADIWNIDFNKNSIRISWHDYSGFGEVLIYKDAEEIKIQSETMGKDFVKELLNQMVDEAELVE